MANRVIVGKRGSDYGVFASRSGVDVTDTTLTTPLSFDSRAATSLNLHSFGQGIVVAFNDGNGAAQQSITFGGVTYTSSSATITHNLGYIPAFAVRWNRYSDLSSGVAPKVYSPYYMNISEESQEDEDGETEQTEDRDGGCSADMGTSTLVIENNMREYLNINSSTTVGNSAAVCYAYVIFKEENFINGGSF
tara:strand:- start:3801 stop:4376 length:576 start_codon:yes stop_codon:yes gene_type:complete